MTCSGIHSHLKGKIEGYNFLYVDQVWEPHLQNIEFLIVKKVIKFIYLICILLIINLIVQMTKIKIYVLLNLCCNQKLNILVFERFSLHKPWVGSWIACLLFCWSVVRRASTPGLLHLDFGCICPFWFITSFVETDFTITSNL